MLYMRGTTMNQSGEANDRPATTDTAPANGRQVRLRVDERDMVTHYANGFRTHTPAEELMVDFGINTVQPTSSGSAGNTSDPEVLMRVSNRVIMNYYTAKRLAITLSQAIRQHESRFGELKLDIAERANRK